MIITSAASSQMSWPVRTRAGGQACVGGVLLDPVGRRVDPRAEVGERAGEARDLTVDAVDDQRGLHQQGAGEQSAPRAGGEAQGCCQPDEEREDRDLVGREPQPQRQSGQRRRGLAQDERRVEAVVGAVGALEQDPGLVDARQLRLDLPRAAPVDHRAAPGRRTSRPPSRPAPGPGPPAPGRSDRPAQPSVRAAAATAVRASAGRRDVASIDDQRSQGRRVRRTHVVHRRPGAGDPLLGDPHRGGIPHRRPTRARASPGPVSRSPSAPAPDRCGPRPPAHRTAPPDHPRAAPGRHRRR